MNRPHGDATHQDSSRQDAAWLAAALHKQADEHEPDLHRIETRFNRLTNSAEPRRAARRRAGGPMRSGLGRRVSLRLISVPLGVLVAGATATIAVGVTLGIGVQTTHPASQAATSPSPSPTASDHQQAAPGASVTPTPVRPAGTASTRAVTGPSPSASPSPNASSGPVTATGAVDPFSTQYWAQENLTVTTTQAVHGLRVTVTVSGGATVQSTGWWSTIPAANLQTTVSHTSGGLTYDITVKPGLTLQPTVYRFGFQFNRPAAGHDFAGDSYTVTAAPTATPTGNPNQATATGTFAP